ncbi:MAG: hypothetical protein JWQ38_2097 [Flavipsychrobacter sp.]|nr:hypothetical protein [Flavipsychrobacter sp.]
MRPQDIAILLKIVSMEGKPWQISGLANSLFISLSEISESLNRSKIAGLIDHNKKNVNRMNLLEFLEHGIKYAFPQVPGAMVRGIPTAHSHPFMSNMFASDINYVWPDRNGDTIGSLLEPLYAKQTEAIAQDALFYKLLALVDVIRVGKVREVNYAAEELNKLLE